MHYYNKPVFQGLDPKKLSQQIFEQKLTNKIPEIVSGKVRDIINLKNELLIITTDRLSAFDKVLTTIPFKGQILNQLSVFWFNKTRTIIKNHFIKELTPRSIIAKKCQVFPYEFIIRGYLTGSAYREYNQTGTISQQKIDSGLRFNQKFSKPIFTPQTKAVNGQHDISVSKDFILKDKILSPILLNQIEQISLKLFNLGSHHVAQQGLILVDTKYEFGLSDNELYLVDEIHTPDSSRFWYADSYQKLFEQGRKQRKLDKEYIRQWLMERNYMGDGQPPEIPDVIKEELTTKYLEAYKLITGSALIMSETSYETEIDTYVTEIALKT